MPEQIFLRYRRNDVGGHAGRLFDRLRHGFDAEALFYGLERIGMGDTFPARIEQALAHAAVELVGDRPGLAGREQPAGDAAMAATYRFHADLRTGLADLCGIDAHAFQGKQADWDDQFVRLRERIVRVPGTPASRSGRQRGEQPFRVIEHALSPHFQDPNGLLACARRIPSAAVLARAARYGIGGDRMVVGLRPSAQATV
jgi:hypothetical protein